MTNHSSDMRTYILLLFIFCFTSSQYSFAQKQRGWGGDVSLYFNSNQNIGFHYAVSYHWMLNKYVGTSVGAMFFHTKLDSPGWWGENQKVFYSLENENVKHFNVTSSFFVTYPIFKNTGLYNHTSLFFEPIPIEYISLNKTIHNSQRKESKEVNRVQYSRFSPGAFTEVGVYHDFKKRENGLKLFCGLGYGWYNVYSAFQNCTIDNQQLSRHIPTDKKYYRVSIKVIGF